jgi:isoleucyl-tRNA synthetase
MSDSHSRKPYPEVPQQPNFPEIERRVLDIWRREGTFQHSVERRPAGGAGQNEFVFYDGPPFANGLPHFGHLLTGYVKDVVPRYQTLRGRRVERRFGWDCHGLPAEMEAEKELRVSGRAAIQTFGIGRFNAHCRTSVLRYTEEWQRYVTRAARWVDFEHDYKTMDLDYMESVLWAFKRLWEKGLLYEGQRVVPYSWAAETPLSNFETRLDDAYREREDPAITVRFRLHPDGENHPTDVLAWTTTPWTLVSNLALAVGPEIDYAILEHSGRRLILGEACVEKYASELAGAERVGTLRGAKLVGRRYEPLTSKRERESSTSPPASARTTWKSARPRRFPSSVRWTTRASSLRRYLPTRACRYSARIAPSSRRCARATCSSRKSAMSTTTLTAGAPTRR